MGDLAARRLVDLLWRTNGISWKDGYGRLFGVGQGATRDIATWNSRSGWKSRYPPLWSSYLLIGEDARGYQWGFRIEELGSPSPTHRSGSSARRP